MPPPTTIRTVCLGMVLASALSAVPSPAQEARIASIEIIRRPILDHAGSLVDELVNGFHVTTAEHIIRRELLFAVGESLDPGRLAESERNLRSTGLFSDVQIRTDRLSEGEVHIRVITRERWTFSASAMMTQEAGVRRKYLTISEKNVLGTGRRVGLGYNHSSLRVANPHGFQGGFEDPRLFGSRWRGVLNVHVAEEYRATHVQFDRPFYSEDARWSAGFAARNSAERLWYNDQSPYASESFRSGEAMQVWYVRSFGEDTRFRLGGAYLRTRTVVLPQFLGASNNIDLVNISAGIMSRAFTPVSNANEIGNVEYVQTGFALSLVSGFNPSARQEDVNTIFVRLGTRLGVSPAEGVFVHSDVSASGYTNLKQFRDATVRGQTAFLARIGISALAGRMLLVRGINWSPARSVSLGGSAGLRGYRLWEFAGTNAALLNLEARLFPELEFLYFRSALALFLDTGTTWWERDRFPAQRWKSSAGVGLRIGNRRFLGSTVIRIDLAYNMTTRQWGQIILATDQVFQVLGSVEPDMPTVSE